MRLSFNFFSLFFFVLINITVSEASLVTLSTLKKMNVSNNIYLINDSKIGIVDFRNILKESLTMKKLGKEFLKFEKRLNDKIRIRKKFKKQRAEIIIKKNKIPDKQFNLEKNNLKKEITNYKSLLFLKKRFKSFVPINSKKTKRRFSICDKKISKDKKIDLVVLRENIFLINNFDLDLTNEALKEFDAKTSKLKIQLVKKR